MVSQRYERIPEAERQDGTQPIPTSPPPSFRSRDSSPNNRSRSQRAGTSDVDPTLEDTFNVHSDDEDDDDRDGDDRQRLIQTSGATGSGSSGAAHGQSFPAARPATTTFTQYNDGVFANLNAKPESGEKSEEQPPSYEQAAADATPPYWETTLLAPGLVSDEVYIDGLPVGSVFSFAWNAIISMAFQLVGFLLTYLLHTTHAAKNGSRAGLGITLISWGFQMKASLESNSGRGGAGAGAGGGAGYTNPPDPNSHDFDPTQIEADPMLAFMKRQGGDAAAAQAAADAADGIAASWMSYVVMIVGWIILIKALMDFVKARRHEQLILQSPDRGLSVPIVADGETMEHVV